MASRMVNPMLWDGDNVQRAYCNAHVHPLRERLPAIGPGMCRRPTTQQTEVVSPVSPYLDPVFLQYLLAGVQFAIGDLPGETTPSAE